MKNEQRGINADNMAPRNNDASPSYKKECPTEEDDGELDETTFVPSLLHKKHKVVKLVRSQLKKIQEEGLLNYQESDLVDDGLPNNQSNNRSNASKRRILRSPQPRSSSDPTESTELSQNGTNKGFSVLFYLLAITFSLLLIILLAVWISAGPLSNPMAYTPIPPGSFVRTDSLCSLEKKYLLRWSKREYL